LAFFAALRENRELLKLGNAVKAGWLSMKPPGLIAFSEATAELDVTGRSVLDLN
jgi:hypothetical protein